MRKADIIPAQEIALSNRQNACAIASLLLEENYTVLLSKEDELTVINYIWSPDADRNNVVFMDRSDFESNFIETTDEEK